MSPDGSDPTERPPGRPERPGGDPGLSDEELRDLANQPGAEAILRAGLWLAEARRLQAALPDPRAADAEFVAALELAPESAVRLLAARVHQLERAIASHQVLIAQLTLSLATAADHQTLATRIDRASFEAFTNLFDRVGKVERRQDLGFDPGDEHPDDDPESEGFDHGDERRA